MRKITEISKDSITVKVMFDAEWQEYRCQLYVEAHHQGEKTDYHTDDKQDAMDTAKAMLKEAEGKEHLHTLKKGDIVYNSWGYDQTNVDFFQIIKCTKCFVILRPIGKMECTDGRMAMTGHVMPRKDQFTSEETTRHKAVFWRGRNIVTVRHGGGCKWDGEPKRVSSYA